MTAQKGNIFLILVSTIALAAAGYLYFQNLSLVTTRDKQPQVVTQQPFPTSQKDEMANWKTFSDSGITFKYPINWTQNRIEILGSSSNQSLNSPDGLYKLLISTRINYDNGTGKPYPNPLMQWSDQKRNRVNFTLGGQPALKVLPYTTFIGQPGETVNISVLVLSKDSKIIYTLDFSTRSPDQARVRIGSETFDQILSTFKFIEPTPDQSRESSVTYPVPPSWRRLTTSDGPTMCLPPSWELRPNDLIFNRDPGYKPTITTLQVIPYSGGSRRQAYFDFWKSEYPDVQNLVSVTEVPINNATVLKITPVTSEVKESPEGLAVVWYSNGKLWKAGLSSWRMINSSLPAFLKDFYTAISCGL